MQGNAAFPKYEKKNIKQVNSWFRDSSMLMNKERPEQQSMMQICYLQASCKCRHRCTQPSQVSKISQ